MGALIPDLPLRVCDLCLRSSRERFDAISLLLATAARRDAARGRIQHRKELAEADRAAARAAIRDKRRQLNLQRQELTRAEEHARDAEIARRDRVRAEQARVARAAAAR